MTLHEFDARPTTSARSFEGITKFYAGMVTSLCQASWFNIIRPQTVIDGTVSRKSAETRRWKTFLEGTSLCIDFTTSKGCKVPRSLYPLVHHAFWIMWDSHSTFIESRYVRLLRSRGGSLLYGLLQRAECSLYIPVQSENLCVGMRADEVAKS
jgi:hypothetical protein